MKSPPDKLGKKKSPLLQGLTEGCLFLILFSSEMYAAVLTSFSENASTIGLYKKYEAVFTLDISYSNPFDTDIVEIWAEMTCPDATIVSVPAFYFRQYQESGSNPETYSNPGPEQWRFRFSPTQVGPHSYSILLKDASGTQTLYTGGSFTCIWAEGNGFIRIHSDHRTFRYDNGLPRIHIGHNVAWTGSGWAGAAGFEHYFEQMSAVGENWARIWMCPWSGDGGLILEWRGHPYFGGPGRLSMEVAQRLDRIVEAAEEKGIAIQLTLQYHGAFSTRVNPNWDQNPYNLIYASEGGFLAAPEEFFTHPEAIRLTKNKYRYIVARWGYSPAIFAWELWNEVQYTGSETRHWWTADYRQEVRQWHQQMAAYIKSIDVHRHPVTTSDYYQLSSALYELEELDIVQEHFYESPTIDVARKMLPALFERFGKPVMAGEFGNISGNMEDDRLLIRNGIWAGFFLGQSAHPWWWDRIDPYGWSEDFLPLCLFAQGQDLASLTPLPRAVEGNKIIAAEPLMEGFDDVPTEGLHCDQTENGFTGQAFLSTYLHAPWSPKKSNPYFHLHMPEVGQFILFVQNVSVAGALIQILIDGNSVYSQSQPAGGSSYQISVPISSGSHTVRVINQGPDWIEIRRYEFRPNTISIVDTLGLVNNRQALIWIYDTHSQEGQTHSGWTEGQTLTVRGLEDGWYNLEYYLTRWPGGAVLATSAYSSDGLLQCPLPAFERDTAVKITEVMDLENLVILAEEWLHSGTALTCDWTGNHRVDAEDFAWLAARWMNRKNYQNPPQVLSAGEDRTLTLEGGTTPTIQLNPTVQAIGHLTFEWTLHYTGPAVPSPQIEDVCSAPSEMNPFFCFSQVGTYVLTLTARDSLNQSDADNVSIEVVSYPRRFEAEDADLSQLVGGNSGVYTDPLASGGKYCLIDWSGTPRIVWTIEAPAAGTYNLYVRSQGVCCYEGRGDYLKVNGGSNRFFPFGNTPDGQWTTFGPIPVSLAAGPNTIQIIRSWGGVRYDYIELPDL